MPAYRRVAAALFSRRNDAVVYFEHALDVSDTQAWLAAWNAGGRPHLTLFALVVYALARTLHEAPRLNRFVSAGTLYQRDGVWLSFAAKKAMEPGAPLVMVKRRFAPDETLAAFAQDLGERLRAARSPRETALDRETAALGRLPAPLLAGAVRLARAADALGLLPDALTRDDPFFASAFLANLGSVGGGSAYHHLSEYGNVPIFATLGHTADEVVARNGQAVVRPMARVRFAYDERIEDGFNAIRALGRFVRLVEHPDELAAPRPPA